MCLFLFFSLKIKKLYNHRNVAKQFNKLKIWINSETTLEGLKNSSYAEFISASIYKEIPKLSWIIVSHYAVAHFICSANIIRYAPCYFEFRTTSSLYTKSASSEWLYTGLLRRFTVLDYSGFRKSVVFDYKFSPLTFVRASAPFAQNDENDVILRL